VLLSQSPRVYSRADRMATMQEAAARLDPNPDDQEQPT
jgi:hypothetical protein